MQLFIKDVPPDLIEQAARILNTGSKRETVIASLTLIVKNDIRRRHAERLRTLRGMQLDDPEVMASARR